MTSPSGGKCCSHLVRGRLRELAVSRSSPAAVNQRSRAAGTISESTASCPDGEIGRRTGLKIPGPERGVTVRVRLRAPTFRDPSLRSGLRQQAPPALTPAKAPQLKIPGPESGVTVRARFRAA